MKSLIKQKNLKLHAECYMYHNVIYQAFFISCYFYFFSIRRVHITEATLKHLNKAYEVEEGNGHLRDPYLKELNIKTYLVIDPRVENLTQTLAVRACHLYVTVCESDCVLFIFVCIVKRSITDGPQCHKASCE